MVRPKSAHISIAAVCLVLGIMLSVQFQTSRFYHNIQVPERTEDLTSQIKALENEKTALQQKAASLTLQLQNSQNHNKALTDLQNDLSSTSLAVGLAAIEGPGITITVDDNPQKCKPGDDPNDYLIHDRDLLILTNELKAAGAEAICINNQRLVAMSEIRCVGTLVIINGAKTGAPFIVKVIGNPDILYGMMKSDNSYLEALNMYGYRTAIEKSDTIKIPALAGKQSVLHSVDNDDPEAEIAADA